MKHIAVLLIFISGNICCVNRNITLYGELDNLPDGMMFLKNSGNQVLDSALTKNGVFKFKIPREEKNFTYQYVTMEHMGNDEVKRLFHFKTNKMFKNGPWLSQFFILEDGIKIGGNIVDFDPKEFKLPNQLKLVYPDKQIEGGKQSWVMFNVDYNFSRNSDDSSHKELYNLIKKYPYSYYLLHEISANRANYTAGELKDFMTLFEKDLHLSEDFKAISKALDIKRDNAYSIKHTKLQTLDNLQESIVNEIAQINMIILWASWCKPCIAEIPDLTKVYNKYKMNSKVSMTSVSLDTEIEDWKKALIKYPMPWLQLWMQESVAKYGTELFQFNGSIPTVIFVNKEGKIINKISGYDKGNLNEYIETIDNEIAK